MTHFTGKAKMNNMVKIRINKKHLYTVYAAISVLVIIFMTLTTILVTLNAIRTCGNQTTSDLCQRVREISKQ